MNGYWKSGIKKIDSFNNTVAKMGLWFWVVLEDRPRARALRCVPVALTPPASLRRLFALSTPLRAPRVQVSKGQKKITWRGGSPRKAAAEAGRVAVAKRRAAAPSVAAPAAAANHPARAPFLIQIPSPLPYISVHVKQTPAIWLLLPQWKS